MTQEEKELLLKDLCARLPYGVKIKVRSNDTRTIRMINMKDGIVHFVESDSISPFGVYIEHPIAFRQAVKPYLRPMSSITEEERKFYYGIVHIQRFECNYEIDALSDNPITTIEISRISEMMDWLNAHHFDYRGLISKGLAIKAPEGMYKTKTE